MEASGEPFDLISVCLTVQENCFTHGQNFYAKLKNELTLPAEIEEQL